MMSTITITSVSVMDNIIIIISSNFMFIMASTEFITRTATGWFWLDGLQHSPNHPGRGRCPHSIL